MRKKKFGGHLIFEIWISYLNFTLVGIMVVVHRVYQCIDIFDSPPQDEGKMRWAAIAMISCIVYVAKASKQAKQSKVKVQFMLLHHTKASNSIDTSLFLGHLFFLHEQIMRRFSFASTTDAMRKFSNVLTQELDTVAQDPVTFRALDLVAIHEAAKKWTKD